MIKSKLVFLISIFFSLFVFMTYANSHELKKTINIIKAEQKNIQKILLVVAMDTEAAPIIKSFDLQPISSIFGKLPMKAYIGKYNNFDISLIINGEDPMYHCPNVGTQAAVLSTYLGINQFHPDLIISIGTAGGVPQFGAQVGDIFISRKVYFYDRRIDLPQYQAYGLGGYVSADFEQTRANNLFKKGNICSGDSFDSNQTDTDVILSNGCAVREMEAAGVAWVSMLTQTPMLAMKGITDIIGTKTDANDFEKNFQMVTTDLAVKLKLFFNELDSRQAWIAKRNNSKNRKYLG